MCEINPKQSKFFALEVFTSSDISENEFEELVYDIVFNAEQDLNRKEPLTLRFHIHETKDLRKEY